VVQQTSEHSRQSLSTRDKRPAIIHVLSPVGGAERQRQELSSSNTYSNPTITVTHAKNNDTLIMGGNGNGVVIPGVL
jgi:hypothetical protein